MLQRLYRMIFAALLKSTCKSRVASQERLLCEFLASLPEDTRKKVTGVEGI